ncbi:MAG: Eukaryotic cytochrome b561 [Syntrophaceae bacterium PtaB.Bin095]|jgi:hypothetical protein|nr:MAG: Eukaryotic cytochrome b561 [Syntrophaceae bacterium PtaB.Bin095]
MNAFYIHAGGVTTGFLLLAAGFVIVRFFRQKRWWLKHHRAAGYAGAFCFLGGLAAAVAMVAQSGEAHLKPPHAWLGVSTIAMVVATPVIGQMQFKIRARIQQLRSMHRWLGRTTLALAVLTLLSGLRTAGVI